MLLGKATFPMKYALQENYLWNFLGELPLRLSYGGVGGLSRSEVWAWAWQQWGWKWVGLGYFTFALASLGASASAAIALCSWCGGCGKSGWETQEVWVGVGWMGLLYLCSSLSSRLSLRSHRPLQLMWEADIFDFHSLHLYAPWIGPIIQNILKNR